MLLLLIYQIFKCLSILMSSGKTIIQSHFHVFVYILENILNYLF